MEKTYRRGNLGGPVEVVILLLASLFFTIEQWKI